MAVHFDRNASFPLSQCHVWYYDHGCNCLLLGPPKSSGHPPGCWPARGPATLSFAQGKAWTYTVPAQRERESDCDINSHTSKCRSTVYNTLTPHFLLQGVVRIHLLEAENLPAKDNYVMAGLSDPYALLRVGPQTFTSKHVDNTQSPKWGEMYEVGKKEDFMHHLILVSSLGGSLCMWLVVLVMRYHISFHRVLQLRDFVATWLGMFGFSCGGCNCP